MVSAAGCVAPDYAYTADSDAADAVHFSRLHTALHKRFLFAQKMWCCQLHVRRCPQHLLARADAGRDARRALTTKHAFPTPSLPVRVIDARRPHLH
jgi:hypothetical protein